MFETYKKITNSLVNWISHVRSGSRGYNRSIVPRAIQSKFLESIKYGASKPFVLDSLVEMSIRYSPSNILTVGSDVILQNITADDLSVQLLKKATIITGSPSLNHIDFHKQIYFNSVSKAVLLCHPQNVFVLYHKKISPDFSIFPDSMQITGGFSVTSPDDFSAEIKNHHLLLIPEIGLFSHANELVDAINQVEVFEWICSITLALAC